MKTFFILMGLLLPLSSIAQKGTCGANVKWELSKNTLTITGDGSMEDFNISSKIPSWSVYKSQIKHIVVNGNVEKIGDYAFYEYKQIVSVTLGEGVKKIGNNTFYGCDSLSSLSLPTTLEEIGDAFVSYSNNGNSFYNCISLKELTLPQNVRFIGSYGFYGCNIEKIKWEAVDCSVDIDYSRDVFEGCPIKEVEFGPNVKSIPEKAFIYQGSLSKITTHGTIEYVGANAFKGTEWLRMHSEEEKLLYIDHAAYIYIESSQNTEPISLTIKEGTISISNIAFSNNKRLVKVILPTTLKSIGDYTFENCSCLGEVEYNSIEVNDFHKAPFGSSIWSFTFGDKVKRIPSHLLENCTGISELELPASLNFIGEKAFNGCSSLKELIIPDNVEEIGKHAIYDLQSLYLET